MLSTTIFTSYCLLRDVWIRRASPSSVFQSTTILYCVSSPSTDPMSWKNLSQNIIIFNYIWLHYWFFSYFINWWSFSIKFLRIVFYCSRKCCFFSRFLKHFLILLLTVSFITPVHSPFTSFLTTFTSLLIILIIIYSSSSPFTATSFSNFSDYFFPYSSRFFSPHITNQLSRLHLVLFPTAHKFSSRFVMVLDYFTFPFYSLIFVSLATISSFR